MVAAQGRSGRLASAEDVRGAPAGGEEQFRALLELAPDAMVIVDHRGVIRLVNAQTEEMFGYRRGELLGRPVEILLPERFRADRFVRDALDAWNQAELAPTACLLVSELLTNAMRHTSEPIGLRLHYTEHEIIAEISDDHPQLPRRTLPAPADEDGRGLTLVEALADRWGSLPANGSKIVWFALATDGSAGRERYLRTYLLPVRCRRSYLLSEYARCFQRREMTRRRHHPQAHLVEEVAQPVRPLGGEQWVMPRPQHRRGYLHPSARRWCLLSHRAGDRACTSPVPADGRDEGPRRRVEPGNTIKL